MFDLLSTGFSASFGLLNIQISVKQTLFRLGRRSKPTLLGPQLTLNLDWQYVHSHLILSRRDQGVSLKVYCVLLLDQIAQNLHISLDVSDNLINGYWKRYRVQVEVFKDWRDRAVMAVRLEEFF